MSQDPNTAASNADRTAQTYGEVQAEILRLLQEEASRAQREAPARQAERREAEAQRLREREEAHRLGIAAGILAAMCTGLRPGEVTKWAESRRISDALAAADALIAAAAREGKP